MHHRLGALLLALVLGTPANAIDVATLWVPGDLAASESRMHAALSSAQGDDALIIRSQLARVSMLRRDFVAAREILARVAQQLDDAGPDARARYWLELGRSFASHQHRPATQTDAARERARAAYQRSLDIARRHGLDDVIVDALHMFAFVDTTPAQQAAWNTRALDVVLASDQPAAQRWEASIRNNLGEAYFELADYERALVEFESALALRKAAGARDVVVRNATWHVARTLRMLGRLEPALALQQGIATEALSADEQRPYIYDELSLLYAALGDDQRAAHFATHSAALR